MDSNQWDFPKSLSEYQKAKAAKAGPWNPPLSPKLVSLGTQCTPASHIKLRRRQRGIVSPFSWSYTPPEIVLDILQDDFKTLLNRNKYFYKTISRLARNSMTPHPPTPRPSSNKRKRPHPHSTTGLIFAHSDPISNSNDYLKLKAQCDFLRKCLNSNSGYGYIISIFSPYEKHKDALIGIRKIIPKACKFFVCYTQQKENFDPVLTEDDIYYGAVHIEDWRDRGWPLAAKAQAVGYSQEFTEMVDKVFY